MTAIQSIAALGARSGPNSDASIEIETLEMQIVSTGEYRAANAELRERAEWFHALTRHSGDIVIVLDRHGEHRFVSGSSVEMLGLHVDALDHSSLLDSIHPDDRAHFRAQLGQLCAQTEGETRLGVRMRHADGHNVHVEALIVNGLADPTVQGVILYIRDITERMVRDPATGLANRNLFIEHLDEALAKPDPEMFAVMLLRVERYEFVRATLGAKASGSLMAQMARRLEGLAEEGWALARTGEREFALLVPSGGDPSAIAAHADAISRAGAAPFSLEGSHVLSFMSIGIALSTRNYGSGDELLGAAQHALGRSNERGSSSREVASTQVLTAHSERLRLETDLLGALERDEFVLHWQPIAELHSGALSGFEALIRWTHPQRGNVPPDVFIPVAEESGLIVPIGSWVLETAIRQLAQWRRQTPQAARLSIAVNLSPVQLRDPDLVRQVGESLRAHGVPGAALKIEVTETAFVQEPDAAAEVLTALRALGCTIAMDDFGTGYCSLQYLTRFPVDVLKIDRSFISGKQGLFNDERGRPLVRAILDLARSLDLEVVAEGIETPEEAQLIRSMGAQYGQGWLIGRPTPAATALELIKRARPA